LLEFSPTTNEIPKRNPSPHRGMRFLAEESKKIPHLAASRRDSKTKSPNPSLPPFPPVAYMFDFKC